MAYISVERRWSWTGVAPSGEGLESMASYITIDQSLKVRTMKRLFIALAIVSKWRYGRTHARGIINGERLSPILDVNIP